MTKLCFLSDTHNKHNQIAVPNCDILCHCGDFSGLGRHKETVSFLKWFNQQPAEYKIYIAGNHDISYQREPNFKKEMLERFPKLIYLEDNGIEINGIKFWGSPWQPDFFPRRWAFNLPRQGNELYQKWQLIPRDTDILLTHSPPHLILDRCKYWHPHYPQDAGCELLRHRVEEIGTIKIHAFGHIHEGFGMNDRILAPTICINVSTCNLQYQPVNPVVEIEL